MCVWFVCVCDRDMDRVLSLCIAPRSKVDIEGGY